MRRLAQLVCILAACSVPSGAQSEREDPYSLHLVQGALKTAASFPGGRTSFVEKRLQGIGDAVSIAMLKILDDRDLAEGRTVDAILQLIRQAFSAPKLISIEEDKKPKVTMFLLMYLLRNADSPRVRSEIQETIDSVRKNTRRVAGT